MKRKTLPSIAKDLGFVRKNYEGRAVHKYLCSCGRVKEIQRRHVQSGLTKSCGCLASTMSRITNTKHGFRNHRLYATWGSMMRRCYSKRSKDYENYGGRGIHVCKRWHNIGNFVKDMHSSFQEGLLLDRIDNNRGYSKSNCRWVTTGASTQNRRCCYVFNGETTGQAAKRMGITRGAIIMRIYRGATLKEAFGYENI